MKVLALDTETNGKDVRYNPTFKVLGVSWATESGSGYFPVGHYGTGNVSISAAQDGLRTQINQSDAIVFHNAKFDLQVLQRFGLDLYSSNWYCTMLMQHFVDENVISKSLESLGQLYFNEGKVRDAEFQSFVDGPGWAFLPVWLTEPYAIQDAELTLKLFKRLYPSFVEQGYNEELWNVEKDFVRVINTMEQAGIQVNQEMSRHELTMGQARMAAITKELDVGESLGPKALEELLIRRLGLPIVKRTPAGKASFDKYAMEEYEDLLSSSKDQTAKRILEYRGWQKATSTYFQAFLSKVSEDGRLRANFNLHRARTSRTTSSAPNLQQIPKTTDEAKRWNVNTKKCITAKSGYTLWEFDYSNLELRLTAVYARQQNLIDAFNKDENVWDFLTALLGGWSKTDTKTMTYLTLYGGGVKKAASTFGISQKEANQKLKEFRSVIPNVAVTARKATQLAIDQGYVRMWTGRRRHFPKSEPTHKAFNAVIQGGGAEIVKRALIKVSRDICDENCVLVLSVHDSIICEISNGTESNYLDRIRHTMESCMPSFGVKFTVDVHQWGT